MKVNDTIHGFRVVNVRHIEEIKADMYEMIHEKTQAKTIWLKRDDENKTFSIAFKTTPVDDTGVFHILEHSVLNGSQRYPVREPFVDLLKGSLQTFLNAMTFPDKTVYPVSSRNDKDFINLMRVYLDAVFHPIAVTMPNIFRQEGWHYELNEKDAQPIFKGVVFNEMKGAFSSPDGVRSRIMMHSLFPDTCYGNESGGDPEFIPTLTYEQFCSSHKKYYNPSNSYIFLDGDMDIETILGIIDDEYLSHYTSDGDKIVIEKQQPVVADDVIQEYEVAPDDSGKGKAQIAYGYVIGSFDDYMKNAAFGLISSVVCGSNESPLKKVILNNGLGEDIYFSMEDGLLQPFVEIDVINTDLEKQDQVHDAIYGELERIVREGIDKDELIATLNKAEFKAREKDFGGAPKGLAFAISTLSSWLYDGDPADALKVDELFSELREKVSTGYYESLIQEYILNSSHHATVLLKPSNTLGQKKAESERQKLSEIKATWSEEKISEIIEMNRELAIWQATEDTPEQQATLPQLHLSDLKKTPTDLPIEVCTHGTGNKVLKHDIDTNGISYVSVYGDVSDLRLEEYTTLAILQSLLGQTATENYDTIHLAQKIKSILGNFGSTFTAATDQNRKTITVTDTSWSALTRNDREAVELVKEILYRTTFADKNAIRDIIRQNKTALEQTFINAGHAMGSVRAAAYRSEAGTCVEYYSGYEAYKFIKQLAENWDEMADGFIADLKALYARIFTRNRFTVSVTSEDKPTIVKAFLDDLKDGEPVTPVEKQPLGHKREGIVVPANISFACKSSDVSGLVDDKLGTMYVLSNILTYDYLWNNIRVKGGAYGCGFACRMNKAARFYSYRDPNPANSLNIYQNTGRYLEEFCRNNDNVEKYIVGTTGDFDPLLTPRSTAKLADMNYLNGITYQNRCEVLDQIINTTIEDIENTKAVFEKINEDDDICVVGNREALEACKDKLDTIYNF